MWDGRTISGQTNPNLYMTYCTGALLIQARGRTAGREPPYETTTYVWELTKPVVFHEPVPYEHRQGVVVWARA